MATSVHGLEIFRFATSSSIAFIPLLAWFWEKRSRWIFCLLGLFVFCMGLTLFKGNSGNYFFPAPEAQELEHSKTAVFETRRQKWPLKNQEFYLNVQKTPREELFQKCGISLQYNMTKDSLIVVISPLRQSQIAPFYVGDFFEANLREDLAGRKLADLARGIVVLREVPRSQKYTSLRGFFVFKTFERPPTSYFFPNHFLQILVPLGCNQGGRFNHTHTDKTAWDFDSAVCSLVG